MNEPIELPIGNSASCHPIWRKINFMDGTLEFAAIIRTHAKDTTGNERKLDACLFMYSLRRAIFYWLT